MKKKGLTALLSLVLSVTLLAGCGGSRKAATPESPSASVSPAEKVNVTVAGLAGPTSIGMIKMISEKALNSEKYAVNYEVDSAPDVLTGKVINGEIQIAALPTNSAAVLYNKTKGKIEFLAQNTLGVLYLVGKDSAEIKSVKDLAGKTISMSGKSAVPEYAMDFILGKAGIKDSVTINYLPDHATVAQTLLGGGTELAVLPQPFVTQVLAKNQNMKILLDINKEWDAASGDQSVLSMGCLVISKDFADSNPEFVSEFLKQYEASVTFVSKNPTDAAKMVADAGIISDAAVVSKAIPYCNIVYKNAQDAKSEINGFLKVLYDFDPASVGGKMPDDGFYYSAASK